MDKPKLPFNEAERLQALHAAEILDTESEERFDRLTRLARRLFDVPIALVSLVDKDRQWFKSCMGLDVRETARDISFCGHTILGDKAFVISDAREDSRFADNPLVTGPPNIRFYAGYPLHCADGSALGTLCLIDQKPRELDAEELEVLADLATMAEKELAAVQLATTDELTQISNRRGFSVLAKTALSLCARNHIPATLVVLDLDNFKPINDQFGHAEGDRALVTFAEQLRLTFRDSDLFGRIGGDEFALLLTDTDEAQAHSSLSRLSQAVSDVSRESRDYDIEFSAGVLPISLASASESVADIDELIAEADQLMYQQKRMRR